MTSPDAPPTSRRALRERARAAEDAPDVEAAPDADVLPDAEDAPDVEAVESPAEPDVVDIPVSHSGRIALAWVDIDSLGTRSAPADLTAAASPYIPVLPELVRNRRSPVPALATIAVILALLGGYTAVTQLWPTDALVPAVENVDVPAVTAPASELTWPDEGVAAAGVGGMDAVAASSTETVSMASITKLIAVLMVLERDPLAVGEEGPTREISYSDRADFWATAGRGESALNVPVGGTLTQYQLLQGVLMASAGNYVDMLTRDHWPTDASFAAAARTWLDQHGLEGISVVEATGIDRGDTGDAASLIRLGELAMAHPVVAEIVATESAEIPGVGEIENTNPLLGSGGVVGIKTGGLTGFYNLLAAADVEAGDSTVRVFAVVLGQPTEALRESRTQDLLDQIAAEATVPRVLAAGTTVATVTTAWGTDADVVTASDAAVLLWNRASATPQPSIEVGDARDAGATVGSVALTGPLGEATADLTLSGDLGEPDAWWRLTHPLELFGLAG